MKYTIATIQSEYATLPGMSADIRTTYQAQAWRAASGRLTLGGYLGAGSGPERRSIAEAEADIKSLRQQIGA